MSRQQLRQILAPALFASEFLLLSYNEKLILLDHTSHNGTHKSAYLLLYVNRRQHPACLCSNLLVPLEARFSARIHPDELGMHCIQKAPQACFDLITQDFL